MTLDPYGDFYLHYQAQAYFQLGNYGKAAALLQQRLTRNPHTDISHMLLAASYGHLGRTAEARAEWAEVFRANPNFSLEHRRKVLPYRNSSHLEFCCGGSSQGGLGRVKARRLSGVFLPPQPVAAKVANDAVDGAHSAASECQRVVALKRTTMRGAVHGRS